MMLWGITLIVIRQVLVGIVRKTLRIEGLRLIGVVLFLSLDRCEHLPKFLAVLHLFTQLTVEIVQ